jgi:DNA-directed RNA polymerase specialized sigma24 family protein
MKNIEYGIVRISKAIDAVVSLMMEGDRRTFDEIYKQYWKRLYNDSYKRLKSLEKIEEIIQDVFSNLWTSGEKETFQHLSLSAYGCPVSGMHVI